jgi:hypothetical protein
MQLMGNSPSSKLSVSQSGLRVSSAEELVELAFVSKFAWGSEMIRRSDGKNY